MENNKLSFFIIAVFILLLSSCDLFIMGPYGRENPGDYEAQIGRFAAVEAGNRSIVVAWDWRDPWPGTDASRVIEEIQIAYNRNSVPVSRLGGDRFSKSDGWSFTLNNMDTDDEHWFALYAKETSGIWLAPIYTRIHLNNDGSPNTGFAAVNISNLFGNSITGFTTGILPTNSTQWAIIRYDLTGSDIKTILAGSITIGLIAAAAPVGDVWIVPLRWRVEDFSPWDSVDNTFTLDMANAVSFYMDANTTHTVDIKDVLNLAHLNGSNTIALIPFESGGAVFEITTVNINYDYWGKP